MELTALRFLKNQPDFKSSFLSSYLIQQLIVSQYLQNQSMTDRQDDYYNPLMHARWGLITFNITL